MLKNRKFIKILIILSIMFLTFESAGYYLGSRDVAFSNKGNLSRENGKMSLNALKARNSALRQRLKGLTPNEIYIVIDTGRNRLYLKRGQGKIREAVISAGSGSILKDPAGKRQWIFDTPRGEYHVQTKYLAPEWTRPDWAFIEEGEAIPKDPRKRVEEGVLGEYALGFGNGYFIHGTLYTRLLGRNVTHGCIRVGDRDLKTVYSAAGVGTRIYIF
ncbi:MAG: L,D-transpeptidase [Syntrophobacterales bacterium CG_4_8_14_3_um_filter_58_8]|nr:MAG: L,D-transpeptidase [Syntrophobacterales bacterium CG03_land_8_20_14_0_80_58_14]PJC73784.1 MAG: L,D-transpeptidase [Syntrophobacterales bacterium CG_4_8_14_3_um_filter_58_8]